MKTICIVNLKGGVGKSTTATNLAWCMATLNPGKKVLLVDADKQGNSSSFFGALLPEQTITGLAQVLTEKQLDPRKAVHPAYRMLLGARSAPYKNLFVMPGGMDLHRASIRMQTEEGVWPRENRLRKALETLDFDFTVIDCPPDINLPVVNAMVAATEILIPTTPDEWALTGMEEILEQVEDVRAVNPRLGRVMTLLTNCGGGKKAREREEQVVEYCKKRGADVVDSIRSSDRVREASVLNKTVCEFSPRSCAAKDYARLALWLCLEGEMK